MPLDLIYQNTLPCINEIEQDIETLIDMTSQQENEPESIITKLKTVFTAQYLNPIKLKNDQTKSKKRSLIKEISSFT